MAALAQNIEAFDVEYFWQMLADRKDRIEAAPADPLPTTYKVNTLAKMLHPQRQSLKIEQITEHPGADAKTFRLVPDSELGYPHVAFFVSGQYLSFQLQIGESRVTRPYSINCDPVDSARGNYYTITVKRSPGGFVSNYILDNWKIGMPVVCSGPEGHFSFEMIRDAKHVLAIAGGSGITPFRSLSKAIASGMEDCYLTLLYGCRTEKEILFKEEFDALAAATDRFRVVYVLSDEEKEGYEHGFIGAELIQKYAPADIFSVFMCGPQAMYRFADKEVAKLGIPRKYVRHELFGTYTQPEKNADYPREAEGKSFSITVRMRDTETKLVCPANETLLSAMERAGINAPSKCRSGECGFCHSRLVSGEVYIPAETDGRRIADRKFGFIHPCSTFPVSDVVIDVPPAI